MKMAGATEQAIADQLGVSKTQIWNDVKRRLAEVRRRTTRKRSSKNTTSSGQGMNGSSSGGGVRPPAPMTPRPRGPPG
jgi:hypothetical protein